MPNPEELLLSAVIRDPQQYTALSSAGVDASMFHSHRDEMQWVERHVKKHGKPPSRLFFKSRWPDFTVYKVDDVSDLIDTIKQEHARYVLTDLMESSIDLMDVDEVDRAVRKLHTGLLDLQRQFSADTFDIFSNWESTYQDVSDRVDRVRTTGSAGVPTGFPTLDDVTGGMQAGWLGIIAARLGQGKTWTGVRMGCSAAFSGHKVCYFSLEQNKHQIALRAHTFASSKYGKEVFKNLDLMKGRGFDIRSYRKFLEALPQQVSGVFEVNDSSRGVVTPMTIAATIERNRPDIVFIDYLTLLGTSGEDWRATAKLSSEMQQVAQKYQIPIMAVSQVNRLGIGNEPPNAEHLSQSDAIGQDADLVLTMMQKSTHVLKMKLAKFRHGPSGVMWYCRFSPGTGHFEEVSGDQAADQMEADQEVT
jgi:replicative DNA helicase